MRILKLLNKISLSIIFLILLLATKVIAEETPVDIWNIDKKEIEKISTENLNFPQKKILGKIKILLRPIFIRCSLKISRI